MMKILSVLSVLCLAAAAMAEEPAAPANPLGPVANLLAGIDNGEGALAAFPETPQAREQALVRLLLERAQAKRKALQEASLADPAVAKALAEAEAALRAWRKTLADSPAWQGLDAELKRLDAEQKALVGGANNAQTDWRTRGQEMRRLHGEIAEVRKKMAELPSDPALAPAAKARDSALEAFWLAQQKKLLDDPAWLENGKAIEELTAWQTELQGRGMLDWLRRPGRERGEHGNRPEKPGKDGEKPAAPAAPEGQKNEAF